MKYINLLLLTMLISIAVFSQDLIIKRTGEEIKSKVLEVSLTVIKYKKFDNLTGPTFEILKSDVFMIKYENGTKDVINAMASSTGSASDKSTQPTQNEDKSLLSFTDKHRSTSIAYGLSALFGGITSYGSGQSSMAIGPLLFSFDKALSDKFSLSFRPAVMYYQYKQTGFYSSTSASLFFGGLQLRVDYHFATSKKLDPYFGIGGGVGYFFGGNDLSGIKGSYPIYGGGFGLKSYGKGKNAFLIELGFDSYSYLKVGYVFGRHN